VIAIREEIPCGIEFWGGGTVSAAAGSRTVFSSACRRKSTLLMTKYGRPVTPVFQPALLSGAVRLPVRIQLSAEASPGSTLQQPGVDRFANSRKVAISRATDTFGDTTQHRTCSGQIPDTGRREAAPADDDSIPEAHSAWLQCSARIHPAWRIEHGTVLPSGWSISGRWLQAQRSRRRYKGRVAPSRANAESVHSDKETSVEL